jgi:hypothetical protein
MGLEYICERKGHYFRINTDVLHDDAVCKSCGGPLVKHEYGFTEPEIAKPIKLQRGEKQSVSGKILHDLSEIEKLAIARSGGDFL